VGTDSFGEDRDFFWKDEVWSGRVVSALTSWIASSVLLAPLAALATGFFLSWDWAFTMKDPF